MLGPYSNYLITNGRRSEAVQKGLEIVFEPIAVDDYPVQSPA